MPDSKQLAAYEACLDENPQRVCNFILNNNPDVRKLLAKKEKSKAELFCKCILPLIVKALCVKD